MNGEKFAGAYGRTPAVLRAALWVPIYKEQYLQICGSFQVSITVTNILMAKERIPLGALRADVLRLAKQLALSNEPAGEIEWSNGHFVHSSKLSIIHRLAGAFLSCECPRSAADLAACACADGRAALLITTCVDVALSGDSLSYLGPQLLSHFCGNPTIARLVACSVADITSIMPTLAVGSMLLWSIIEMLLCMTSAETPGTISLLATGTCTRALLRIIESLCSVLTAEEKVIESCARLELWHGVITLLHRVARSGSKERQRLRAAMESTFVIKEISVGFETGETQRMRETNSALLKSFLCTLCPQDARRSLHETRHIDETPTKTTPAKTCPLKKLTSDTPHRASCQASDDESYGRDDHEFEEDPGELNASGVIAQLSPQTLRLGARLGELGIPIGVASPGELQRRAISPAQHAERISGPPETAEPKGVGPTAGVRKISRKAALK